MEYPKSKHEMLFYPPRIPPAKVFRENLLATFVGILISHKKINEKFLRTDEPRLDFHLGKTTLVPIIKPFGIFSGTESQKCEYLDNKGQETTSHPTSLASIYFGFFQINIRHNITRL